MTKSSMGKHPISGEMLLIRCIINYRYAAWGATKVKGSERSPPDCIRLFGTSTCEYWIGPLEGQGLEGQTKAFSFPLHFLAIEGCP